MQQCLIPLSDKENWEKALHDVPHGPAHRWAYNQALYYTYGQEIFLYHATADKFTAICPIAIREKFGTKDIVTPYGFGGLITQGVSLDFQAKWHNYFREFNYICGYFALHPLYNSLEAYQPHQFSTNNIIYILDLNQSLNEIEMNLAKVHRYELRRWKSMNVELTQDKDEICALLPELYSQTLERTQAKNVYKFSKETLTTLVYDTNTIAIGAKRQGKIEAIAVFTFNQHIGDYFLNAASIAGRDHTRGLIWSGIEALKQQAVPLLNLGGGIQVNDSLDDFKRRFGGFSLPTNAIKEVFNEKVFQQLCARVNKTSLAANYFPPYYAETKT